MSLTNSYSTLNSKLFSEVLPTPVRLPGMFLFNEGLAAALELPEELKNLEILSGNAIPTNTKPIAQAYAGHQFGGFTMLGDGRAILLGEHTFENQIFDIQLKGSGPTPYSRRGDGRATLKAMLREYIISEAMHALQIPTTRSLAVVTTGEDVYRNPIQPGAVLTRIANSHIRVGTFEYIAQFCDQDVMAEFLDYTIQRHYANLTKEKNKALALTEAVINQQVALIVNWLRVGFIHGVMNTDNMSIAGETLDYGPCAFMNAYDPATVYSSIDVNGRYAFGQQGSIALWNITRFAETLLPLIATEQEEAVAKATEVLNTFQSKFSEAWLRMMCNKLGLKETSEENKIIIVELLQWMKTNNADYTNTFVHLSTNNFDKDPVYHQNEFLAWKEKWHKVTHAKNGDLPYEVVALMQSNNPFFIPRNHLVEDMLEAAEKTNSPSAIVEYLNALQRPYDYSNQLIPAFYFKAPDEDIENVYQTFCGT